MLDMQRGSEVRPSICAGHLDGHTTRLPAMQTGIKQELQKPRPKYAWLWGSHPFTPGDLGGTVLCSLSGGVTGDEMMQWSQLSLNREDIAPPPPSCSLDAGGCFSFTVYRLCSFCTLHVTRTVLPWLTPGSGSLISCDKEYTQFLDFKGEDAFYTHSCTHKYIP